jgi:radical SAM protein with 4Fe4S-binding SPASM domain
MNEEYFDWIVKEDINISTSLDGPKELHDKIRKYENGTGTYDDVVNWLARFNEKGKRLGVLMVTTRYSLPYWKEIIDEYVRWGITNIQIKPLNKLGFAEKTWEEIGYTTEEFLEFWKKCVDYILELNKKGIEIRERYINLILDKLFTIRDPAFLDFRSPCGTVIGQLAYNYNGDIYSCDEGRNYEMFKLGNVKTDSYADIIVKDQSKMLVSSTILENFMCDACAYKPFCGSCPVISYAEDNNIISKLAKSSKCKMFKSKFDYVFQKIINEKWPSQT